MQNRILELSIMRTLEKSYNTYKILKNSDPKIAIIIMVFNKTLLEIAYNVCLWYYRYSYGYR